MSSRRSQLLLTSMLFLLTGCERSLSGTFADEAALTAYEFHDDGSATIFVLGTTVSALYTLDGNRVLVTSGQGTVVLTRRGGHLYGPMGLELVRQPE